MATDEAPMLILVTGDPVEPARAEHGTFVDMIVRRAESAWVGPFWAIDARLSSDALPDPREVSGLIVTGSPASMTEIEGWMRHAEAFVRRAVDTRLPTLGICFGHQLLASALGGRVERNPRGREIGSVDVRVTGAHPWLGFERGRVNSTHVDSVVALPPGARSLGHTALEENAIIAFTDEALGVQFHPEIDAAVMRHYIEARREIITAEGLSPDEMLHEIDGGLEGKDVLVRFCADVGARARSV
jgi:GMP synthase (glutamine-hydrolysing)